MMIYAINKWWYFNPLFVLYTDDPFYISMLKDPDEMRRYFTFSMDDDDFDPFDYDKRQMRPRDSNEIESQIVNHDSAKRLRKTFAENNDFDEFLGPWLNDDFEKLPVALITFVLSVLVATDFSLRKKFYHLYQGSKIPAITQFCLNTFRVSPISNNEWITDFDFIDDEYRATQGCCGLACSFADKEYMKLYPERMLNWFSLLEEHFNGHEKPYMEYVDFKRVASVSSQKNYLCGLTIENERVTSSESSYFQELSHDKKEVYMMLARVLDCVCVPENTELIIPHTNLLERSFDEGVMTAKLIGFIVWECKSFLA